MADERSRPMNPHKQTEALSIDETGRPLPVVGGDPEGSASQAPDAALQETRRRLQAVLNTSVDAAYRWNLQTGHYDYMSPVIEQIIGLSAEEMCALSLDENLARIHPEDRVQVAYELTRSLAGGRSILEYRFQHRDGQYRWVADHIDVLTDSEGWPLARVGFLRDITERKLLEEAWCEGAAVGRWPKWPHLAGPDPEQIVSRTAKQGIRHTALIAGVAGVILLLGGLAAMLHYRAFPRQQISQEPAAVSEAARQLREENTTFRLANDQLRKKVKALTGERNALRGRALALERRVAHLATRSQRGKTVTVTMPTGAQAVKAPSQATKQPAWPLQTRGGASVAAATSSPGTPAPQTLAMSRRQGDIPAAPPLAPDPPSIR